MVRRIGFGEGTKAPARSVSRTGDPPLLPRLGGGGPSARAGAPGSAVGADPASAATARPPGAETPAPDATALLPAAPEASPPRPKVQGSRLPVTGAPRTDSAQAARAADPVLTGSRRARVVAVLLLACLGALAAVLVAAVIATPVRGDGAVQGLGGLLVVVLIVEVFILRWLLRRWVGRR